MKISKILVFHTHAASYDETRQQGAAFEIPELTLQMLLIYSIFTMHR